MRFGYVFISAGVLTTVFSLATLILLCRVAIMRCADIQLDQHYWFCIWMIVGAAIIGLTGWAMVLKSKIKN